MTSEKIKSQLYNYAPRSWFTVSGLAPIKFSENANIREYKDVICFRAFRWYTIRFFLKEAYSSSISMYISVNGQTFRSIIIPANQQSLTYTFNEPIDMEEEESVRIELHNRDISIPMSELYVAFNNSTWECFLDAATDMGTYIDNEINSLKEDIFLNSAKQERLNQWANDLTSINRGVYDNDPVYRKKIITELLRPKQTIHSILEAVNSILNEYYPPSDTNSGNNYNTVNHSGAGYVSGSNTGYKAILIEPWHQDAPFVPIDDKGQPGQFYLTIPIELINEKSEVIFNSIIDKVERIKTKGIKVNYVKELLTANYARESYERKISDSIIGKIEFGATQYLERLVYTLTGVSADLEYISNYELENFYQYNDIVNVIRFKNNIAFKKNYSVDAHSETYHFNNFAFYVGQSELGKDLFIFEPFNFDRMQIRKINNTHGLMDEDITELFGQLQTL